MLRLSNSYFDRAILSLRVGSRIGTAHTPIINPNNLKIEGWYATGIDGDPVVLPTIEVRDFVVKGIVVNDYTALTAPDDLVRLKSIIDLHFELLGKQVITEHKRKLGKVSDFAVDEQFLIQSIYVTPTLFKSLTHDQLIIGRNSILEITEKHIIVSEGMEKSPHTATAPLQA